MRTIKFRAWDKERKKIFCPVGLFWNRVTHGLFDYCKDKNETRIAVNICSVSEQPTLCPFIIMQYTGLKDEVGKEIYEGDILEFTDTSWDNKKIIKKLKIRVVVAWQYDGYKTYLDINFKKLWNNGYLYEDYSDDMDWE